MRPQNSFKYFKLCVILELATTGHRSFWESPCLKDDREVRRKQCFIHYCLIHESDLHSSPQSGRHTIRDKEERRIRFLWHSPRKTRAAKNFVIKFFFKRIFIDCVNQIRNF